MQSDYEWHHHDEYLNYIETADETADESELTENQKKDKQSWLKYTKK